MDKDHWLAFLPILFITLFVLFPDNTIVIAHTVLGKFGLILLILLYAHKDILYGIVLTLLSIVFYQMESTTEGMNTIEEEFKDSYCVNNQLTFKSEGVKPDMAEHIFPKIQFDNEPCNVCDSSCKVNFSHYTNGESP
jgi:hypothetical protein